MDSKIISAINEERVFQNEKWGHQEHDDYIWLVIATEELGEIAHEVLHGGRTNRSYELKHEIIQTIAVLIAWYEQIHGS